ncbi:related to p33ING1b (ING1) protein [Cephalotrichum gorgonifer]|uniref:Chromatin modification-related protein n=1 Tax=Cephalotrichum gorgonifer TaxID=2041049 RepID=A0AAE8N3C9_9PEZI|nr:related to p33ING1b (ING1) protein [Cephalotrichum gorgonifer]
MRSPAVDAASGRRLQPARQARTNPHRATGLQRTGSRRGSIGGPAPDQPIDIFPGVEHFADAITALPKELVRHFTLLKEVDAKSSAPEQHLQDLVQACLDCPFPRPKAHADAASPSSTGGAASAQNIASTVAFNNPGRPPTATDEAYRAAVYDQSNMPRRQLFLGAAARIKDMLMSLDERNHVICTANEALQRQLARVEDIWPHLEAEFSEEAKWGSNTHWAYPENRLGKAAQNERPRRDGQSTAAQQAAEEAAARSDARKQAVQAKKNQRNQAQDDGDGDGRQKAEGGKRAQGAKSRKVAEAPGGVGLGITAGSSTNGSAPNPPSKRRKVEKPVNGGAAAAERAMSTVFGNASKAKSTTSPRGTPAPDGQKKRKALPSGPTQVKKSRNGTAGPASAAASPILSANPDPSTSARASPVPPLSSTPRPTSARSKPNTSQAAPEPSSNANGVADNGGNNSNGKAKQVSSAPDKPNGTAPETPDLAQPDKWPQQAPDEPKHVAQQPEPASQETSVPEAATKESDTKEVETTTTPSVSKKETPKPEPSDKKIEPLRPVPAPITAPPATHQLSAAPAAATPPTVTTKSGRASKPSTPALATFQEAATARSRSSRTTADSSSKRGHKKSASQSVNSAAAPAVPPAGSAPAANNGNGTRARIHEDEEEEGEIDADEPTYCYCNSVSYGAMVACDADECAREWFHLECVGLKVPPKTNVKWYCEDCKKRMKIGEKKGGGGR